MVNRITNNCWALPGAVLLTMCTAVQPAIADSDDFETFTVGLSVNGQGEWTVEDSFGNSGELFDEAIVDDSGNNVWRISNAFTSTGYSNHPFSSQPDDIAGESGAQLYNDYGTDHTMPNSPPLSSGAATSKYFHASMDFKSATDAAQPGLSITMSASGLQSTLRQTYLRITDSGSGFDIDFYDTDATDFNQTILATGLSYDEWHTLEMYVEFVDGIGPGNAGNDIVTVLLNGSIIHVGSTWESYYYLVSDGGIPAPSQRAVNAWLFRMAGTADAGNAGNGFYIDNVTVDNASLPMNTQLVVSANEDWCADKNVGDTVSVDIDLIDADYEVAGGEFLVAYDADKLDSPVVTAGDDPFDVVFINIPDPLSNNDGTGIDYIFFAVGDQFSPDVTDEDTRMATLTFTVESEFCSTADIVVLDPGAQPLGTYMTNVNGVAVPYTAVNLDEQTIDDSPPVIEPVDDIQVLAEAGGCTAVVTFPTPTITDNCSSGYCAYEESFETTDYASSSGWNDYDSLVTRVPSGTDGISSSDGAFHAVLDSSGSPPTTGAFTRLGGYTSSYGDGFRVCLDVYMDLSDPAVIADTYGWDLTTAATDQGGSHLQDFIFHTASNASGNIFVGASNNTNFTRRNDLATINHYEITSSGWYKFEWVFRDFGDGTLAVDLNLRDSSGTHLWTETRHDAGNVLATVVGGNRYMWFTFLEVESLAVDANKMTRGLGTGNGDVTVDVSPASGSVFSQGINTVTITATDVCGNQSVDTFDVEVLGDNEMIIDLAYDGALDAAVERCVEFVLSGVDSATVTQEVMFTAAGEADDVSVLVPCGDYDCVTVRDPLHTLASSVPVTIAGTEYEASATGADEMIGGNLNGDPYIDILDFGIYIGQYGSFPSPDTTCSDAGPHADISGNGLVGSNDFTFIQINFLAESDSGCTALVWNQPGPVHMKSRPDAGPIRRISLKQLERRGLGHMKTADLNKDGWLDEHDIVAFLQGERP